MQVNKKKLEQLGGYFQAIVNHNFSEKKKLFINLREFDVEQEPFNHLLNFSHKLQSGVFDRELYKECAQAELFNQFTL